MYTLQDCACDQSLQAVIHHGHAPGCTVPEPRTNVCTPYKTVPSGYHPCPRLCCTRTQNQCSHSYTLQDSLPMVVGWFTVPIQIKSAQWQLLVPCWLVFCQHFHQMTFSLTLSLYWDNGNNVWAIIALLLSILPSSKARRIIYSFIESF